MVGRLRISELELAGGDFGGRAQKGPIAQAQGKVGAGERGEARAGRAGETEFKDAVGMANGVDQVRKRNLLAERRGHGVCQNQRR